MSDGWDGISLNRVTTRSPYGDNKLWLIDGMKFGKIFWYWTGIDADHDYDDDDNEDNDDDDYYNHDDDMWHLNLPLNMEETSPNPLIQALL